MQKFIKGTGPSRQLFETVNFAFMKIFDFLVKIAIFEAFFHFLWRFASYITGPFKHLIWAEMHEANLSEKVEIP